jgi:hypothetical protein
MRLLNARGINVLRACVCVRSLWRYYGNINWSVHFLRPFPVSHLCNDDAQAQHNAVRGRLVRKPQLQRKKD